MQLFLILYCIFKKNGYICSQKPMRTDTMKTQVYILRPVTDTRDIVLYYEFVRKEDDAILRSSEDYNYILAYADGFATARDARLIVE